MMPASVARRHTFAAGLLALASISLVTISSPANAQSSTWPERPITFIVPFPAGGGTDIFARPLAAQLDTQLGQRIVIDNRGGAGGTVGASAASKAASDGYTFFVGAAHHTIAPALYPKLDYDLERDFIPIGLIAAPPQVIVVNPEKVPAKTLPDFITYLKANPGVVNFASSGNGTTHQLAGELFMLLTGTKMAHVPYRGAGPAMQDLVAGHVQVMFDGLGSSSAQINGGGVRALALASAKRSTTVPNVPTAAEAGLAGYDVSTWYALFAPKNTPPQIIERMARELRTALDAENIKSTWQKSGSDVPVLMRDEFGKYVSSEIKRWGGIVKEVGVKLD
jgi:tripartite-type tricarboxylate transporter receptor subunit TctC